MGFAMDVEAAAGAALVEEAGDPEPLEMEFDVLAGAVCDEHGAPVEPVYEPVRVRALASCVCTATVEVGGTAVVRAVYDAAEEVYGKLADGDDPAPCYDEDDLLRDAPEWVGDPVADEIAEGRLAEIVEAAGGALAAAQPAGMFSGKRDKVEALA